jgi:hypothetical protein
VWVSEIDRAMRSAFSTHHRHAFSCFLSPSITMHLSSAFATTTTTVTIITVVLMAAAVASVPQWALLRNPVLAYPNWSIKVICRPVVNSSLTHALMHSRTVCVGGGAMEQDSFMVPGANGTYFVFFSCFYDDGLRIRSQVVQVSTVDFVHYRWVLGEKGRERCTDGIGLLMGG